MQVPYLEFDNVSKSFPGVKALQNISFKCYEGKVHALMGENGAGKSTLLKILSGNYLPSEGKLSIGGRQLVFRNTKEALLAGVAIIYQELNIVPEMTVAENLCLGQLPHSFGIVDKAELIERTQQYLDKLDLNISPNTPLKELSIGQWQMIEIAKALSRGAKIIAFDEPTSSLSAPEIEKLFSVINELRDEGKVILYVSHRMEEIFRISDEITVLKDGQFVETFSDLSKITNDDLVRSMVGRNLGDIYHYRPREVGDVRLKIAHLSGEKLQGDFSLTVRAGEVLGLFGLVGAGRSELLKVIFGADPCVSGSIELDGKTLSIRSPKDAIEQGIVLCPEDRKKEGIVPTASVGENINISARRLHNFFKFIINDKWEKKNAEKQRQQMNVKTPSIEQLIVNLSGGNQQKAILGRWLSEDIKVLLLDEPTRGIDVGAKSEIYDLIFKLADQKLAIIVVSSDLPEVIGVSDRIMVMRAHQITGVVERADATEEKVLKLAMVESLNVGD
ncbi:L-arabinose ABC transporter ATP-binding protein AraG [[Mannheimia] succiniciproducens]|uniref:Arabinose import ATP-binding protein AraG n=1 Tax=Mannheimia succiniciproducens (strain KCTC 0769BP / MBEL55E) TaxID=221988 RepID=ARAG_MANSM|nr:L-arabinose ABC transporter ATP-binding protein AraG [[Mannheimia] succiniciproducens]Q65WJ1.1 RecName: Full=Arabinose import ATP-binding protein AraG [[Mannheimia] succiniciproducens MBEL55E]AAU36669.1 MglA protein [[Mannheimia] succiniciproducens MBEL55E]